MVQRLGAGVAAELVAERRAVAQVAHNQVCKFHGQTERDMLQASLTRTMRAAFWDQLAQQLEEEPEAAMPRLQGLMGELQAAFAAVTKQQEYQQLVASLLGWEQFEASMRSRIPEAVDRMLVNATQLLHRIEAPQDEEQTRQTSERLREQLRQQGLARGVPPVLSFLFERVEAVQRQVQDYRLQQLAPQLRDRAAQLARDLLALERDKGAAPAQLQELCATQWLRSASERVKARCSAAGEDTAGDAAAFVLEAVAEGVLALLEPPSVKARCRQDAYPETLRLDVENLFYFQNLVQRLALVGCLLNITTQLLAERRQRDPAGQLDPARQREALLGLKSDLLELLQHPAVNLPKVQQCTLHGAQRAVAPLGLLEGQQEALQRAVEQAIRADHSVYSVCERILREALASATRAAARSAQPCGAGEVAPQLARASMAGLAEDVALAATQLGKLVRHNAQTHAQLYQSMLP